MSGTDLPDAGDQRLSRKLRIHEACERFEAAWRAGMRPTIEAYLGGTTEPGRPELFAELLALELELRQGDGEGPAPEEYRVRFPADRALIESVFDSVRRPSGAAVDLSTKLPGAPEDPGRTSTFVPRPASTPASAAGPDRAGTRFQIVRLHAQGGQGEVLLAHDAQLNRDVALKRIQDRYADDPLSRARFLMEAEITGGLEHPGIVPVHALGQAADGRPFYIMRFIKGESLKDAIQRFHAAEAPGRDPGPRRLELRKLLDRFLDVCNAVAYAHSRGVVHRDLKPGNVVLGPYGETLVVDWGLAKALGLTEAVAPGEAPVAPRSGPADFATQPGAVLGTPAYMSPEQAGGLLQLLGPTSDVYSLGATLYQLLTGRPPVAGRDVYEILGKARRGEIPRPREVARSVPRALEAVCLKAMARDPEDRYPSPKDLAEDLEHWLADEPVTAWREPWGQRLARWSRRHRTWVRAGAAALVLVAIVATLAAVLIQGALTSERDARKDEQIALGKEKAALSKEKEQRGRAESERREAQLLAARLMVVRGQEYFRGDDPARGILWMAQGLKAAPRDHASLGWYLRANLAAWSREINRLKAVLPRCQVISDGALLSQDDDGTFRVRDAATGRAVGEPLGRYPLAVPDKAPGATGPPLRVQAASHDGRTFVTATPPGRDLRVWDVATGRPIGRPLAVVEDTGGDYYTHPPVFSPDDKTIMTVAGGRTSDGVGTNTLRFWDVATGTPGGEIFSRQRLESFAFSPSGQLVVGRSPGRSARIWDLTTRRPLDGLPEVESPLVAVAFSPGGETLALGYQDGSALLCDAATRRPLGEPTPPLVDERLSPTDRALLAREPIEVRLEWLLLRKEAARRPIGPPAGDGPGPSSPAFSPDGRFLLVEVGPGQEVRILSTATGLPSHPSIAESMSGAPGLWAFGPDSKAMVARNADGTCQIWDLVASRPVGQPLRHPVQKSGHTIAATGLAFAPDGRVVATSGDGGTARLWETSTGRPVGQVMLHTEPIISIKFTPDGKTLALVGNRGGARLWDVADAVRFDPQPPGRAGGDPIEAVSPDGRRVVTSRREVLQIRDAQTGAPIGPPLQGQNRADRFSSDGRFLTTRNALIGATDTTRVWDAATGQPLGPPMAISSGRPRLAADGKTWILEGETGSELRDVATGRLIRSLKNLVNGRPGPTPEPIEVVDYSPDGTTILCRSLATAWLLDAATGQPRGEPLARFGEGLFRGDGRILVTVDGDFLRTVRSWEADPFRPLGEPLPEVRPAGEQVPGPVLDHRTSGRWTLGPDGKTLATAGPGSGGEGQVIRIWDATTGTNLGRPIPHPFPFGDPSISHDGRSILLPLQDSSGSHHLQVYGATTGQPAGPPMPYAWGTPYGLSPDGSRLLLSKPDRTVEIRDVASGRPVGAPLGPTVPAGSAPEPINGMAFSPDGRVVATMHVVAHSADPLVIRRWDATTGRPIGVPWPHPLGGVGSRTVLLFSPDGTRLVSGAFGTIRIWDVPAGEPIGEPIEAPGQSEATRLVFASDGRRLLVTDHDVARLWDVATSRPIGPVMSHAPPPGGDSLRQGITGAAFSPDGRTIATVVDRSTVRRWDASSAAEIGQPIDAPGEVHAIRFSADGRVVLAGVWGSTVRLIDTATGRPAGLPIALPGRIERETINSMSTPVFRFSPDGRILVTRSEGPLGQEDSDVRLWDVATGRAIGGRLRSRGHTAQGAGIFRADGTTYLTRGRDGTALLWDTGTGRPLGDPIPPAGQDRVVALSPDGRTVFVGAVSGDDGHDAGNHSISPPRAEARLWDSAAGRAVGEPIVPGGEVIACAFSPDGAILATEGSDATIRYWDARSGLPIGPPWPVPPRPGHEIRFRPDGRALLLGPDSGRFPSLPVPHPLPEDEDLAILRLQVATGMELDLDSGVKPLDASSWDRLRRQLEDMGGSPPP